MNCNYCNRKAIYFCNNCCQSFCNLCITDYHNFIENRKHNIEILFVQNKQISKLKQTEHLRSKTIKTFIKSFFNF